MMTILDSLVNKIGRVYDHLMSTKYCISSNAQDIHISLKNHEESGYNLNLDSLSILYQCVFHILGKWASREKVTI